MIVVDPRSLLKGNKKKFNNQIVRKITTKRLVFFVGGIDLLKFVEKNKLAS